jgi:two-component system, cell cycle sensor histidine kinase and response regulator CckA
LRAATGFSVLFAQNPLAMCLYDDESLMFLEVNDAAIELYGYSRDEFLAMHITELVPPEDVGALLEYRSTTKSPLRRAGIWRHRRKDETVIDVEIHSHTIEFDGHRAVLVVMHDVSEQRRLELQLLHAQKMEAVGRLAGGIAHDFNNVLTAVLGYSELMLESALLPPSLAADVREIRQAATSAADLIRQLLAFGRKQLIQPIALDINAALQKTDRMLQRVIGEDITVVMRLSPDVKTVHLDQGQFEQVVMNLAVNARDAMARGGTLTIETSNQLLDETYARQHLAVTPGEYVMLAISDTGAGMDPKVLPHIFEPFFTTKPAGQGTGLGLATVYGVVKQNHGNIWVYSEVGRGTTFKIYIPVMASVEDESIVSIRIPSPGGAETILVVEDDPRLRRLAERSLARLGYTVLLAATSDEALAFASSHDQPIHLLLTDVVMPDMGGAALAAKIAEVRPGITVLFCSGYTEAAIAHHGVLDSGVAFLHKPFTPDALARKVRDVLDASV